MKKAAKVKKGYSSIFRSIFISYITACIIILAVTAIGYWNYYRMFKDSTLSFARQQAATVVGQVEKGFLGIRQALNVLSTNSLVKEAILYSDQELSTNAVAVRKLQGELASATSNVSKSDTLIYFYKSDSVIGSASRRYNHNMLDIFCGSYGVSEEEFRDIVGYSGVFGSHVFDDGRFWMMQSVYGSDLSRTAVLIIESRIENSINYIDEVYRDNMLVLATSDTLLFSSGEIQETELSRLLSSQAATPRILVGQEQYYFVSTDIPAMGWRCFVGIPETKLFKDLRIFWVLLGAELIGAVVLMLVLSWKFARKTYQPVEQLIAIVSSGTNERFRETYESLSSRLKALMDENRKMMKKARKSQAALDTKKVSRILNGEITDSSMVAHFMESFAHIHKDEPWIMALINISEDGDELFKYDQYLTLNEEDVDLKFFVLKNVAEELIFSRFPGNLLMEDGWYVLLAGLNEEDEKPGIMKKFEDLMDFYKSTLNIRIHIMTSGCLRDFENIARTYQELVENIRYNIFWLDDVSRDKVWDMEILQEDQIPVSFGEYLDSSRRLFNCLDAGDYKEAYKILDYIFQKTFPRNRKFFKYNIYRMYGLISTLTMTLNARISREDSDFVEKLNYEERLFNVKTIEQLMQVSKELFDGIISYNAQKSREGMPVWMAGVLKYIQDNYTDMNISVAEIADQFQISVPHLSRTFKSCMGNGVLEYIHKLRVEKAKELMAAGKNVREAAEAAGYLDAKALTRAFKRYEGITPGQYRDMLMSV